MILALCIPTRGVIFARTIKSTILNPQLGKDAHVIIVEGLPIPDSHNECIRRALSTNCTHILFVEEDVEVPPDGIRRMVGTASDGARIVAIDYPIAHGKPTIMYVAGKPYFAGFGCTLFDRTLFEKEFHDPWLTDKYSLGIVSPGKFELHDAPKERYGKFDIYFGYQCQQLGIQISVIPNLLCKHLRMKTWERKITNVGMHDIYEL